MEPQSVMTVYRLAVPGSLCTRANLLTEPGQAIDSVHAGQTCVPCQAAMQVAIGGGRSTTVARMECFSAGRTRS